MLELIDPCLARLGQDDFAPAFLDAAQAAGADQVMVFAYRADAVTCLLSRNFIEGRLGTRLAEAYVRSGFRDDPLHARVLALEPRTAALVELAHLTGAMPPAYRTRFFDAPGLGDKVAVLAAGERLHLVLNLYRTQQARGWPEDLLRVLGRLAVLHFEARSGTMPEALLVLSDRERAVCEGILAGQKAEVIAHSLGVAATSVITYRKRAYAKLGISSRAGLFAICRG
ncbi:helix-turn-helix transcriptional regulator [Pararhodobacter zhoushanensis]|uniref:Helix-turn-helix transcriptional regulator n=1 Tax=Pararhodobacter zhoushanensis TaxID=2479545 RepID=A0ABT3GTQ2_9RHOB|nr:helix-turn-helix transcriptional regulator [Pararhodobacter zhoushanensis]MCW1930912.1 helix-turn-helix transcriptional regulator [Pararhodobacter zhoushanensis]